MRWNKRDTIKDGKAYNKYFWIKAYRIHWCGLGSNFIAGGSFVLGL